MAIVGWLWADILLGLFAIFLAANSAGAAPSELPRVAVDPQPLAISVPVDGRALLSGTPDAIAAEQTRISLAVARRLDELASGRRVAIVLAFGVHEAATEGDRLARLATAGFAGGPFEGATVKPYHELAAGVAGTELHLDVYLYY